MYVGATAVGVFLNDEKFEILCGDHNIHSQLIREAQVNMPSDFKELVKIAGSFAILVVVGIVLLMIFVSIVDRYPRPRSRPRKDEDSKSRKP